MKILISFLILICSISAMGQKQVRLEFPWITISQIDSIKADTFQIKAQVLEVYRCPPCPEGAECKPCIGNHLVVKDTDVVPAKQARVFIEKPDQFTKRAVYIFTLTLQNKFHPEFGTNLVHAESLKK